MSKTPFLFLFSFLFSPIFLFYLSLLNLFIYHPLLFSPPHPLFSLSINILIPSPAHLALVASRHASPRRRLLPPLAPAACFHHRRPPRPTSPAGHGGSPPTSPPSSPCRSPASPSSPRQQPPPRCSLCSNEAVVHRCLPAGPTRGSLGKAQGEAGEAALLQLRPGRTVLESGNHESFIGEVVFSDCLIVLRPRCSRSGCGRPAKRTLRRK
jgi:hypothetical protein